MTEIQHLDASALKDKSIIVTGGASGIGLAAGTRFAQGGAYVTLADVQVTAGEKAAEALCSKGYHVSFAHCDTTNWESSNAAFKHATLFGPWKTLDVAVLNAGVQGDHGSLVDQVLQAPEPSLEGDALPTRPSRQGLTVNLLGVYDGCWLALHYMRLPAKTGPVSASKSLILTGSLASYGDMPFSTDYNASKFGVRGIFRGLRHATSAMNVRVNLVAPYWVNTPMLQGAMPQLKAAGVCLTWSEADDVVDAMVRSATDENANGKVWGVWPEGYTDFADDQAGE